MASRELYHRTLPKQSIAPAAKTASANGTGVDTQGFESVLCIAEFGVATDGTHTLKLQDSPDNSVWTDVPAASVLGAFTAVTSGAGGSASQTVAYIGAQRYVRVASTVSGATTGAVYGASFVLGHPRHSDPQTAQL